MIYEDDDAELNGAGPVSPYPYEIASVRGSGAPYSTVRGLRAGRERARRLQP